MPAKNARGNLDSCQKRESEYMQNSTLRVQRNFYPIYFRNKLDLTAIDSD